MRLRTLGFLTLAAGPASAEAPLTPSLPASLTRDLDARIAHVSPKVAAWRRDLHAHPELSYAKERRAGVVAAHLKARDRDPFNTPANHTPLNDVDEAAMPSGIKALSALALDALLHGVPALRPVK